MQLQLRLEKNNIPTITYPQLPSHLPTLDLLSKSLISPRIQFIQIRQLRHAHGIFGQIINVPVSVNTIVNHLPRNIDDDHYVNNVHSTY